MPSRSPRAAVAVEENGRRARRHRRRTGVLGRARPSSALPLATTAAVHALADRAERKRGC